MSTNYSYLEIEKNGDTAIVTINREDKLNALNKDVLTDLRSFFGSVRSDETVKAIVLTGAGEKAFIAGADIASMSSMTPEEGKAFAEYGQEATLLIEECPKPVISAVNGYALGGGLEFALSGDFILATENAVFALPEVSLGLIPGFGGTQRLTKIIGRHRAKELIYTGRNVKADEAKEIGLVLEVFDHKEALIEGALGLAKKMSKNSSFAIAQAKKVINLGADERVSTGLEVEAQTFGAIFSSHDMKEGTTAFTEKRKPNFKGK